MEQILLMVVVFGGMMWFMSRNTKKQQAQRKALLDSMKPGDKVVTIGGLHGVVAEVRKSDGKNTVLLDCEGIFLEFDRIAVKDVVPTMPESTTEVEEVASEEVEEVVETKEDNEQAK